MIPIFVHSVADSIGAVDKFSQSLDELSAWNRANPGLLARAAGSHQPFYLAYRPRDVGGLLSRYGDLVGAEAAVHERQKIDDQRLVQPRRNRIRMVVVSGQVRHHPVWDVVLRGIIAHMDARAADGGDRDRRATGGRVDLHELLVSAGARRRRPGGP